MASGPTSEGVERHSGLVARSGDAPYPWTAILAFTAAERNADSPRHLRAGTRATCFPRCVEGRSACTSISPKDWRDPASASCFCARTIRASRSRGVPIRAVELCPPAPIRCSGRATGRGARRPVASAVSRGRSIARSVRCSRDRVIPASLRDTGAGRGSEAPSARQRRAARRGRVPFAGRAPSAAQPRSRSWEIAAASGEHLRSGAAPSSASIRGATRRFLAQERIAGLQREDWVITTSEATRADLAELGGVDPSACS